MKIAFVAPFGLGQKTTVWARTLPLAKETATAGHNPHILIPPWDTPTDAGRTWTEDGVILQNVTLGGGIPGTVRRMLHALDAIQPDLIHIVKPRAHAGLVQWLLWQRRQRPPILLDVDDWEQAWTPINGYHAAIARFLGWQEEWGIRHADGITAASRWLEKRAHAYAPATPALYLPNGVALPEHGPAKPTLASSPTVLFFSRYVEVTPAWLAAFWQSLYEFDPTSQLVVAGRPLQPDQTDAFVAAMASHGATAAAVEWRGAVAHEELASLYARAAVAIFPADRVPLHQAKCSVRLATTLLHGVPVVASAVGEQAAYGADGAARLMPTDATPQAFAAAVADLLKDGPARTRMIDRAHAHLARHYRWRDLGQRLLTFYDQILTGDSVTR